MVEKERTAYVYIACERTDSSMLSVMTAKSYQTLSSSLSPDKGPGGRVCQLTVLSVPLTDVLFDSTSEPLDDLFGSLACGLNTPPPNPAVNCLPFFFSSLITIFFFLFESHWCFGGTACRMADRWGGTAAHVQMKHWVMFLFRSHLLSPADTLPPGSFCLLTACFCLFVLDDPSTQSMYSMANISQFLWRRSCC